MNTVQDHYVQVGPIRARYWSLGSEGSPVLLVHGIGRFVEDWLPSLDGLADRHRVYAVDLPGHGHSDMQFNKSSEIKNLALFIKEFMSTLGIENAHLIGHSLGGAVGTWFALSYPEMAGKLVLVASGGFGRELSGLLRITSVPIVGELLSRPSRKGIADFAKFLVHDPAVMTPDLLERDYQMAARPGAQKSFLKTLRDNASPFGQRKKIIQHIVGGIPSVRNPVLVIWGRNDQIMPVAHANAAVQGFPNAQAHIFEDCGHIPMLEHSHSFNQILLKFLS